MINERGNSRVPIHVDIPADQKNSPTMMRFGTTLVKSMNLKRNQVIFDTGASTCATSDTSILRNIVDCDSIKAYHAFEPPVQTKGLGQYGPLGLDMILIDDMKETLVSISELCKGGLLNKQNLVVFTWEGMRGFEINEASRRAMKTLHDDGTEIVRAYQENGVYVLNRDEKLSMPNNGNDNIEIFMAQFKPVSLYDHVHLVTGHSENGGASQARVPQRTPGWVLWTVEEILNYAGEPEPTTAFRMYTSIWIWISTCDRSNSMVMRCNDRCSKPIDNPIAEKILRYDRTILELSFLSTHTSVRNVF